MAYGWFIALGLLWAHIVLLVWLAKTGRMERWKLSTMLGIVLMIRTQRGKGLIEKISKPKRFWNAFGDFGVVLSYIGMALMTFLMLALIPRSLTPDSGALALGARDILVIPGVNRFVPLWYGLIALIVALVVHEGAHGILARANNLKVKSLGLLYAVVPIGAFVEPDEDELMEAPRRHRLRVYAAGATINLVLAVALVLVFGALVGATVPAEGVAIQGVTVDSPAHIAGLQTGDLITSVDGQPTTEAADFSRIMADHRPGDTVNLTINGMAAQATLADRWSFISPGDQEEILAQSDLGRAFCDALVGNYSSGGDCADQLAQEKAFMGISYFPVGALHDALSQPFGNNGVNFLLMMSLPISEVLGNPSLSFYAPAFFETPFDDGTFWILANVIFWIFWINLMLGLTNILPMLPLDGGHLFRDGMGGVLEKLRPNMNPETQQRIIGKLAGFTSLLILGAFIISIIGPRLV